MHDRVDSLSRRYWMVGRDYVSRDFIPLPTKLVVSILDLPCPSSRPSLCPSVCLSVCRRHAFRCVTRVYIGISLSNFICILFVAMGRTKLIFSDVTFKMAWQPYSIFSFATLNLVWLWISTVNFSNMLVVCKGRSLLIFCNITFKMAAIRPYWTFWFSDSQFSLALNIKCKGQ